MSLKYEPVSEPLHVPLKPLFLNMSPHAGTGDYTDKLVYTDVERVKKFLAANNQVWES